MALVITLIMLSLIVVLVMAFLGLSTRERASVADSGSQQDAALMAQSALERAEALILFNVRTNPLGPDLAVSLSFPSTNILSLDTLTNLGRGGNLFSDPRVPVFVNTNRGGPPGPAEFRYYVDLNRNGWPETNGLLPILDQGGNPVVDPNGQPVLGFLVGDPEWIGVLAYPNRPHSAQNRFVGRFAYLIVPVGRTLDVNFIHNQAKLYLDMNAAIGSTRRNGFWRNQGFGSWELNLAAFLADLNTNFWNRPFSWTPPGVPYSYNPGIAPGSDGSVGDAFNDATDFLHFRYDNTVANLRPFETLFLPPGPAEFANDGIDGYTDGWLGLDTAPLQEDQDPVAQDHPDRPWCGADSTNHFFTVHDFFNRAKVGGYFADRLGSASAAPSTYDRYTYYRLLAQLGTDSTPQTDKIHLNYADLGTNGAGFRLYATNFVSWDDPSLPELSVTFLTNVAVAYFEKQQRDFPFFTNAVVRAKVPTSAIVIPIAPTNEYSPAVHRIFQVAANIFDATRTNRYPSVFRPLFTTVDSEVFLTGFVNDNRRSTLDAYLAKDNPQGIPLVIGAKKGYPNFNEYTLRTDIQVTRKLELVRADTNSLPYQKNQMYVLGISNLFGAEAWNSYSTPYSNQLTLELRNLTYASITNPKGLNYIPTVGSLNYGPVTLPANFWQGGDFKLPLFTNVVLLDNAVYRFNAQTFDPIGVNNYSDRGSGFPLPEMFLTLSNRFWYILSDGDNLVDFVLSYDFKTTVNIDAELITATGLETASGLPAADLLAELWDTNRVQGAADVMVPTRGIEKQIEVSLGNEAVDATTWRSFNGIGMNQDKNYSIDKFRVFCGKTPFRQYRSPLTLTTNALAMQTPFCPTRKLVKTTTWQANDPLVHYHVGDLLVFPNNAITEAVVPPLSPIPTNMTLATLGYLNRRYSPWGGNPELTDPGNPAPNDFNLAVKDAGVRRSDEWDFPSGKFPNVGWLGRVHRGTPWQTIYFKHAQPEAQEDTWKEQSSDYLWCPYWWRAHPTNDWLLADLFTVGIGPTATRGLLSVNQTNLAAWSAVFSGVSVLRNLEDDQTLAQIYTNWPVAQQLTNHVDYIQPAGSSDLLRQLVDGINRYRARVPGGVFSSLAQFIQVPELTVRSPWLNTASATQLKLGLNDAAYERLPQQVLSLLKVGEPRFVIYAFGQALKPAPRSVLTDANYFQLCTNYQVVGEMCTRAVARVDGSPSGPRLVIESFNILPTE